MAWSLDSVLNIVQLYIGVSYQFLAAISAATDIVEMSISATDTICIGISVHL